ncbi:hypothetical protein N0V94_004150, partial [Neodidymelliopsis sp. IMI 364377]
MTSTSDPEKAENTMIEKVDDLPSGSGSSNIQDHPKLWPRSLKISILFNICLMTFNGQFFAAGPATSLVYLVQEFRVGYPDVAPLVSYVVLMIGIGSLIWIPTTSVFGKRIVLIASNSIFLVGCIWGIYATSLNSLLGSRIFAGFGAGAVQAIGPAVIGGIKQWVKMFARHLPFIVDPIVLCCAGLWGIVQSWVIVISVCSSQLFAAPPFLFTPAQLGNWTGVSMVGIIIAFPIAGPIVDILSRKLTKMRGVHQPEYRLYSMIVPFIVCSPGLLLFGYTYLERSYVGPAIGFAMQAAGLTLAPSATIS